MYSKLFSMVFHVGLCRSPRHSFAVMSITCACEGVLLKAKTFSERGLAVEGLCDIMPGQLTG